MVRDPNHEVFDRSGPPWSQTDLIGGVNSDLFANISEVSFTLTYNEVETVLVNDPYLLTTTTTDVETSGTASTKKFIKEDGSGTSGRLDDEFRGFGYSKNPLPPNVFFRNTIQNSRMGGDAIIRAGFGPTDPIGTIVVAVDDDVDVVTTTTDVLNDDGDTGFDINRYVNGVSTPGTRADRPGTVGVSIGNSSFNLGMSGEINVRALVELGSATATEVVEEDYDTADGHYTLSRTATITITTA